MSTLTLNTPLIGRPAAYQPSAVVAAAIAAAEAGAGHRPGIDGARILLSRCWAALNRMGSRRAAADLRRMAQLRASIDPDLAARMRDLARRIEAGEA